MTSGLVNDYCEGKEEVSGKECYLMVQRLVVLPPAPSLPHQEDHVQSGGGTLRLLHFVMLALLTFLLYVPRYRSSYPALMMSFILVASPHLVSPLYSHQVLYTSLLLTY